MGQIYDFPDWIIGRLIDPCIIAGSACHLILCNAQKLWYTVFCQINQNQIVDFHKFSYGYIVFSYIRKPFIRCFLSFIPYVIPETAKILKRKMRRAHYYNKIFHPSLDIGPYFQIYLSCSLYFLIRLFQHTI